MFSSSTDSLDSFLFVLPILREVELIYRCLCISDLHYTWGSIDDHIAHRWTKADHYSSQGLQVLLLILLSDWMKNVHRNQMTTTMKVITSAVAGCQAKLPAALIVFLVWVVQKHMPT